MARRSNVHYFNDFTGGLNLDSPRQSLALNETFDCLDVDFDARGGFTQRRGVKAISGSDLDKMNGGYLLGHLSFGTDLVFGVSTDKRLWTWDGASTSHVATAVTDQTDFVHWSTWGNKLYLANCWATSALVMRYRTGAGLATVTTLTNTFNNNYTAPTGGNMPLARLIAQHQGFMWVADTVESSVRNRSRVRWSHPLQPEDWASADYFDIDPDDESDQITALVPFRDMLLVFKRRSVWAVYGYDSDSFVPERLTVASGVWAQEAVTVNAGICYWWSPDGNVYAFNGKGVVPVGGRISRVLDDDVVSGADHRLAWAEDRLYVSLVNNDSTRLCFVYDPGVGRAGAWTKYSLEPTSFVWWRGTNGNNSFFMTLRGKNGIFNHAVSNQVQDEFSTGVLSAIPAYYSTSWFTGGDTALKKQFRRVHLTSATKDPCTFKVDVYYDFNDSAVRRTLVLDVLDGGTSLTWGTGLWGTGVWGDDEPTYSFEKLSSAGRAHAIRFKFYVENNVSAWWIDSFTLPYVEKSY